MVIEIDPLRGFQWKSILVEHVDQDRWNRIIEDLRKGDLPKKRASSISSKFFRIMNGWSVLNQGSRKEIRVNHIIEIHGKTVTVEASRYVFLEDKVISSENEKHEEKTGGDYYDMLETRFNEFNHTKNISLFSKLSGRTYKAYYTQIKACVPTPISFMNNSFYGKQLQHCYKADVSSAFPSQIMKDLPTLHGCRRIVGARVEPTEEYPFAFYVKSHHMKTYDGYDSREMRTPLYTFYKCLDNLPADQDVTILCKKMSTKYHDAMKEAFRYCYDHRKEDADNKMLMNATIGYMHRNNDPQLSFIAATVILRCNIDIIRRCKQLMKEGNDILLIAVDSIAWRGNRSDVATVQKYLGSFTYEGCDIDFLGYSSKCYQWRNNITWVTTTKYSGMKKTESARLKFGELPEPKTVRKYYQYDEEHDQFFASELI